MGRACDTARDAADDLVLWESKSLDNKKYAALSVSCDEIGKMLGGWQGQLIKLGPAKTRGEK
jgi:hypothetical protein